MCPEWLKDAIFYEIYPQSFRDTNADGVGDLQGVIEKLDYVKSLGCNTIWLNPFYDSPFCDAGYDVTDHYKVGSRYGAMSDAEALLDEAHKRGIRVVLDIVPGHTSDQHTWFKESAKHERNQYSDYFIWTDSALLFDDGGLKMIAGGDTRDGAHAINFFCHQPALNYGFAHPNPDIPWQQPVDAPGPKAVRTELNRLLRFWLEKGCDGFRIDMANSLVKGENNDEATCELWGEVREWMDRDFPEAILLAEWGNPEKAIAAGFHMDFMIHFATPAYTSLFRKQWGFSTSLSPYGCSFFDRSGRGNIREFVDVFEQEYANSAGKGFISIPSGNHDIAPRLADGRNLADLKVAFAFLMTMPGVPVIYYGDEIGMEGVKNLPSKEGGYIRTMARTPMQWDSSETAGFSEGDEADFYLPLETRENRPNVETQSADPDSLLHFVKEMTALRSANSALSGAAHYETLYAEGGKVPYVYLRSSAEQKIVVAINPIDGSHAVDIDRSKSVFGSKISLLRGMGKLEFDGAKYSVNLPPVSFGFWILE